MLSSPTRRPKHRHTGSVYRIVIDWAGAPHRPTDRSARARSPAEESQNESLARIVPYAGPKSKRSALKNIVVKFFFAPSGLTDLNLVEENS